MPEPDGIILRSQDGGRLIESATFQCAHCGTHHEIVKGMRRGFCFGCMRHVCASRACTAGCDPYEKKIDRMEAAAQRA